MTPPPSSLFKTLLPWSCGLLAGAVMAAPAQKSETSPLPTQLQFTSALEGYRAYTDQVVQSWREANDQVHRIGGWRAYAKEAATDQTASEAAAADPHAGHPDGGRR